MLLIHCKISPIIQYLEQNFPGERFGDRTVAGAAVEIDRVFILRDASRLYFKFILQTLAVHGRNLRIRQFRLIFGRQLFVLRIRFEDENGTAESPERNVFAQAVILPHAAEDRTADNVSDVEFRLVWKLSFAGAFEVKAEWLRRDLQSRTTQVHRKGDDQIG